MSCNKTRKREMSLTHFGWHVTIFCFLAGFLRCSVFQVVQDLVLGPKLTTRGFVVELHYKIMNIALSFFFPEMVSNIQLQYPSNRESRKKMTKFTSTLKFILLGDAQIAFFT